MANPALSAPVRRMLGQRFWMDEDVVTGWFDLVAQHAAAVPRDSDDGRTVHQDVAGWPEETRAWVLELFADAELDFRSWRAIVGTMPWTELTAEQQATLPEAPNVQVERDPVLRLLDECDEVALDEKRVEVRKVTRAVAAWRAALAQEGRPTAGNTPYQRGFLLDLAHRYDIAQPTALTMVTVADRLERRMPRAWAAFTGLQASWRGMQALHAELDGLDPEFESAFDEIAARKLRDTPAPRLRDVLRRERERLQARTADDRHQKAMRQRTVRTDLAADGMAYTTIYWAAATALALQHQLTKGAIAAHGVEGETRGVSQLKADILEDLAHAYLRDAADPAHDTEVPERPGVTASVAVLIPAMTALGHADAPAALQGYGTIGIATALKLAGTATSWIRVLTDPIDGAILTLGRTRYRPTKDMRILLGLLDGGNRGPGVPRPPDELDVDHLESFHLGEEQGLTDIENLMLLSRTDHTVKTTGEWRPRLLPDRTVVWHTRRGYTYITRPADPTPPTPVPESLIQPEPEPDDEPAPF